jgi:hypothetical protein
MTRNSQKFQMSLIYIYIYIYDRGFWFSQSCDSRHVCRRNTAVAVTHSDPGEALVCCLGSLTSYALFASTESVSSAWKQTVWYDVQAAGCQMVLQICTWQRQCYRQQSKWMTVALDDTSQHCTHQGPYLDWRTCNFVAHGIWLWFSLTAPCSMSW